jgi:asparagine synthase (glutamine-hydrolysing)
MCGIAGILNTTLAPVPGLRRKLAVTNNLLQHRGPDGEGLWSHERGHVGFAHRRLSIIDLSTGDQPMTDRHGNWITYNGEIYNYVELREELGLENFRTTSDTEVILQAYRKWGEACVERFRGMFAFALWDEQRQRLFCARDRFGIKPFYYTLVGDTLYFASEVKALIPFMDRVETDLEGFKDYLTFQFCLQGKTLFRDVKELLPGHVLTLERGRIDVRRYWEVYYHLDWDHTTKYFEERLEALLADSVELHLRSDVPLGAYISGGFDSGVVATMASRKIGGKLLGFTGTFADGPEYDESAHARAVASHAEFPLHEVRISAADFVRNIRRVVYHMDYPAAGPGSFPQYMVSQLASGHRKVVLGGQGGDEIFGGYTRYLVAYFEQCIKAAIEGTSHSGNFVVTYESIIPQLVSLRNYKPMLQEFWRSGLFDDMGQRYYRLINRAPQLGSEIRWELLGEYAPFDSYASIFNGHNVRKESYFDLMTHFDFKTLLPALLQVEDRVSMAHGLESRVPLLDHPLVEFAATVPANVKFRDGHLKHLFKSTMGRVLPRSVAERTDKMGFPTPLTEWVHGEARDFVQDVFTSRAALSRDLVENRQVTEKIGRETKFGRNIWGLLSLELWQQEFHDRHAEFRAMVANAETDSEIGVEAAAAV